MSFIVPDVDDFKEQFPRDFPYAIPAYGATATAVLTAGAVSSIEVDDGGAGYSSAPVVTLAAQPGDAGVGATATAIVDNGVVTGFAITAPGSGYGQAPSVSFSGGAGDNSNLKRVTDSDIQGAILDAQFNFNPGLFAYQPNPQQMQTRAFLYLAAHQMIEKLLMAAAGVQSQYTWLIASKSVAGVSQSFKIPQVIADNPFMANLSKTRYGAMYCQIIAPLLVGNVGVHLSVTNP